MKKMGKKLIAGTAMAITAAAVAGCGPQPSVYGPPEYFETETFNPETEIPEAVYGPPEYFEPESNIPEDVYGPPEYFETTHD